MGPFSGRLLSVYIEMLPGSRTTKQRHISLDSRFMSQWMKAAKNSHALITHISAAHYDSTAASMGSTRSTKDNSQTLIEKMSAQSPSTTKKTETNGVVKNADSKPKANRRRGRRKSS